MAIRWVDVSRGSWDWHRRLNWNVFARVVMVGGWVHVTRVGGADGLGLLSVVMGDCNILASILHMCVIPMLMGIPKWKEGR